MKKYNANSPPSIPKKPWRDHLRVHPAANLFPLMSETDPAALKELGEDIKKNRLCNRVAVIDGPDGEPLLLDGRNRLDAMELAGLEFELENVTMPAVCRHHASAFDPYAYVISANIHRRHLTAEQKRELIATLLKAAPEKSDRQIGATTKADHKTVGDVRADLEGRGEIPHVETRTDTKGRQQPAKRSIKQEVEAGDRESAKAHKEVDTARALNNQIAPLGERAERAIEELDAILRVAERHSARLDLDRLGEQLMTRATAFIELAQRKRPVDDGFDIPPMLDRRAAS